MIQLKESNRSIFGVKSISIMEQTEKLRGDQGCPRNVPTSFGVSSILGFEIEAPLLPLHRLFYM